MLNLKALVFYARIRNLVVLDYLNSDSYLYV